MSTVTLTMKRLGICFAASLLTACGAPMMVVSDVPTGDSGMRLMDAQVVDSGSSDVSTVDAPNATDVQADIGASDVPNRDVVTADRPAVDSGVSCGAGAVCRPFWCGCGQCNPAEIRCVSDNRECLLDCVSSCPELETTVCRCVGNQCERQNVVVDAGADARGGGVGEGGLCGGEAGDCAAGLLCCYPCGIPGCANRCMPPDRNGRCPLLP